MEREILPRIELGPDAFYDATGRPILRSGSSWPTALPRPHSRPLDARLAAGGPEQFLSASQRTE